MAKFDLIIFDLDDTLLDFSQAQQYALNKAIGDIAMPSSEILETFRKINHEEWARYERSEITKQEVVINRFTRLFDKLNLSGCPTAANNQFLAALSHSCIEMNGAGHVCQELHENSLLGIITNGISAVQKNRIALSTFAQHLHFVCISDECGFAKPQPEIFYHALKKISHTLDPERVLMVGDRLDTDVLGAQNAGLKSCWFNPLNRINTTGIIPDYKIENLSELLAL